MEGQRDENGNTFFTHLRCNICLNEENNCWLDVNGANIFKCFTCESGYVCNDCIPEFDPQGSIFCSDLDDVRNTIKCPCCRVENWNYHYNQLIHITLEYDAMDMYFGNNKAIDYFIKQQIKRGLSIEINEVEINADNVDTIDFTTLEGCKYREVITLDFHSGSCSGCNCDISVEECETNQNMMLWKGAMICEQCLEKNPKIYPKKELEL